MPQANAHTGSTYEPVVHREIGARRRQSRRYRRARWLRAWRWIRRGTRVLARATALRPGSGGGRWCGWRPIKRSPWTWYGSE